MIYEILSLNKIKQSKKNQLVHFITTNFNSPLFMVIAC
jgi:hypothetical protein